MVLSTSETIQLIYLIPSLLLMIFVAFLLLYKILTKSQAFKNEFYPMVCYRTFNDILYHFTILILLKLPAWKIALNFYINSTCLAPLCCIFGAVTCCVPFLHTFILASMRYMAIYYPIKYSRISSQSTSIIICGVIFTISYGIGLASLAFPSKYVYNEVTGITSPVYIVKSVAYFQFCYGIIFYGLTVIGSLILNIANFVGLRKNNKKNKNKKSEYTFAFYGLFTLFTTCLMEGYLVGRIGGNFLENETMMAISNYALTWIGDIGTLGDFYFFLFINSEIKLAIKEIFFKIINKQVTSLVIRSTEVKSLQETKNSRIKTIPNK
ncbi:7TM GPCR, serpentine receptor class v (Srv) family-containing protein [Strongyloides ratti]|uniref:7TM GPCR, serpentine receptor class v (Srv) family-containing protein n=1 Tax=Strongyloides ratti TaxID=34506 RepID=A0A090MU20_STRRB|nr:7TM GPCR, serpentine receptor class v (Srv) family-containing protein [Strongyloides ratti]CEF61928.1 7TM GPCR, serpentine receptor class v (Srv) family-containing protein [Strongyloides ratti]